MNDLISRQAAIEAVGDVHPLDYNGQATLKRLKELPTIDAVPVVRCKECKHWGMHKSLNVPWCFEMHIDKSEDGYCDGGERSEE